MPSTGGVGAFADPGPFQRAFSPERIVGRDREHSELRRVLADALDAETAQHVAVYGGEGSGKTLLVDEVVTAVGSDADASPEVCRVSCREQTSAYRVGISLVNALRDDDPLSSSGYPMDAVLETLDDELEGTSGDVVVLDDVDALELGAGSVERLFEVLLADSGVVVVLVAADPRSRNDLDWSVRQSVAGREVHFPPYERPVLERILDDRASLAFHDGVRRDGVVSAATRLAVEEDDANAWTGIQLLAGAARIAAADGAEVLTPADVEAAFEELRGARIREALPDTPHAALALLALAEAAASPDVEPRMRHCYRRYEDLCTHADLDPVGERAVHNYLDGFRRADLLESERRHSDSPGQYYVYHLTVDPARVARSLRETALPQVVLEATAVDP